MQHLNSDMKPFALEVTHQFLAVQEGRSTVAGCSPAGEVEDVVQVPAQKVHVVLLLFQSRLVVLRQALGGNTRNKLCVC